MLMIVLKLYISDIIFPRIGAVVAKFLANRDWGRQILAREILRLLKGGKLTEKMLICLVPEGDPE